METNQQKQGDGFSLIELMIVIVIVSLLAAVAVPLYYNNLYDAKMAEAYATMGSIQTQLRFYYAEYGWYPIESQKTYVIGAYWNDIKPGEMRGINFSDSSYLYQCKDGEKWEIIADKKTTFLEKDLTMKYDGTIEGGRKKK